jgi:hypothetical protein
MKLQDFSAQKPSKQISKVFESYFGTGLAIEQLSRQQTQGMLHRVRGVIAEHRATPARYQSEKNPAYLKLVMIEQALTSRLKEMTTPVTGTAGAAAPGTAPAVDPAAAAAKVKDPKLKTALTKSTKGQTLSPDEQKVVAGAALMTASESRRWRGRRLSESEVQQAQVVLAAQDMVDTMQDMLEDVSQLQFKELPALVDSIKNQVGADQAAQFNSDASAALGTLMQNLQQAKQQMDAALGVVTGQNVATAPVAPAAAAAPVDDMAAPADDMSMDTDLDLEPDLGNNTADLGRSRR